MTSESAAQPIPDALLQRYQTLLEVSDVIRGCRSLDELFRKLAESLRRVVAFDAIAVALLDAQGESIRIERLESWVAPQIDVGFTVPRHAVPAGWVIDHQKPLRVRIAESDPRFQLHNELMGKQGFAVSFHLPLTTSLTRLGELIFAFRKEVELPDAEIEFMQRAANQVAVAIENAGNFDQVRRAQLEVERRNQQRELLLELTNNVVSHLNLEDVLQTFTRSVRRVVACAAAVVALPDPDGKNLRLSVVDYPEGKGLLAQGFPIPIEGSLSGRVFATGTPLVVSKNDPDNYTYSLDLYRRLSTEGLNFHCFIPLVSRGRSLGVLILGRKDGPAFDADEVEFLGHVAGQVTIAIDNARNYQDLEHHNQQRGLLLELTNSIVAHRDLHDVLRAAVNCVTRMIPCDISAVSLPEPDGKSLRLWAIEFPDGKGLFQEGILLPMEGSMAGRTFQSGQALVLDSVDPRNYTPEIYRMVAAEGLKGQCYVPLISRGRTLGVLSMSRTKEGLFSPDDVEFLKLVAGQIAIAVENALAYREIEALKDKLAQEKLYLEDEIRSGINFEEIIGESTSLKSALRQVQTVASSDSTVLILGETGTGKELIARAIHEASRRKGRTFVKLNCAAIPTGLLESELFGHERGAFTGAIAQKIGRMELANGGTLFLDEVGDIPLELQPKLLRALQEREFERLGSVRTQKSDVRYLAATNRHLQGMVAEKQFRSDLFYRLNVFPISIPPLRERRDDIPRLVRYFVSRFAKKMDKHIETVPTAAMTKLKAWHWPGNVRELENFIERSVILTTNSVLHVPLTELESTDDIPESPAATLRDTEREHILKVLREANGVLAGPEGAASRLGLKRTTLQSKMKKLGITRDSL